MSTRQTAGVVARRDQDSATVGGGTTRGGYLLRRLQRGEMLSMPYSRPMPSIGRNCHELRIDDEDASWRVVYRIDDDAIVIAAIFAKKTPRTPTRVIDACRRRLRNYDDEAG